MSGLGDQMAEEPGLQDIGEPKGGRTRSLRTPNTNRGPNRPWPRCPLAAQAPPPSCYPCLTSLLS